MPLLHPGDTFPPLTLNIPARRPSRFQAGSPASSRSCCSTAERGAPTAPPSCARSSEPVIP
jgi:hypothetical protein